MYVCLCKAVTDKQIRKAAEQGCSMRCLINELGLATQCGKCAKYAKQIIVSTQLKNSENFTQIVA